MNTVTISDKTKAEVILFWHKLTQENPGRPKEWRAGVTAAKFGLNSKEVYEIVLGEGKE